MEIIIWSVIFVLAIYALVKGADILVVASEKIGHFFNLSSFVIGVIIVGLGTSLPELVSAIFAVLNKKSEIVLANVFGSNIFNILVIVGLSALFSKNFIEIDRSLIDLDLPLLAISSVLIFGVTIDGKVSFYEGIMLLIAYGIYLSYSFNYQPKQQKNRTIVKKDKKINLKKELLFLIIGGILLLGGAEYAIKSIINLSKSLSIASSVIAAIALAIGTSLPELAVSLRAVTKKNYELAIGNIFGSNIFNGLIVIGLPALFANLKADYQIMHFLLPGFLISTFLFVVSGISQRIHKWEGGMYLLLYLFLIARLLNIF